MLTLTIILQDIMMSNKKTTNQNNHKADSKNPNTRTPGNNPTNAKVHGNRGKQLNPNQSK